MKADALDPFADLEAEHEVIRELLMALEAATPERCDGVFFRMVVDFIRRFADGIHHEKEEQHLFPALVRHGIHQEMGPVGVMLEEHQTLRGHVENMERQILAEDLEALCREGRAYAALLYDHIQKEEQALFVMGRSVLPPEVIKAVARAFAAIPRWARPSGGAPPDRP